MDKLKIKRICRDGKYPVVPAYQTAGAAAMDIHAFITEPIILKPGERIMVPTGIALELPNGSAALVFARSGLAMKHGIALSNGVGLIDEDFRGEIKVGLINLGNEDFDILPGDRIAQIMVVKPQICQCEEVSSLSQTERGEGGFGSTGISEKGRV